MVAEPLVEQPLEVAPELSDVTPPVGNEEVPAATPEQPAAVETPTPVVKDEAYFSTLQSTLDAGEPLTSEQRSELGRHHQSVRDREAAAQMARQQAAANQQRIREAVTSLAPAIVEQAGKRLGITTDDPALELLAVDVNSRLGTVLNEIAPIVHQPLIAQIKEGIATLMGDTPEMRRTLNSLEGADYYDAMNAWGKLLFERGASSSPQGKKATELEAEVTRLKAELLRYDGAAKGAGSPSTNGRTPNTGAAPTYADILKMSPAEIKALPGDAFLAAISGGK